jgi:hypothetical protein
MSLRRPVHHLLDDLVKPHLLPGKKVDSLGFLAPSLETSICIYVCIGMYMYVYVCIFCMWI